MTDGNVTGLILGDVTADSLTATAAGVASNSVTQTLPPSSTNTNPPINEQQSFLAQHGDATNPNVRIEGFETTDTTADESDTEE